ncbi:MAG TPA: hypothetical protein VH933_05290 [Aestuariivirgaceae bacterium]
MRTVDLFDRSPTSAEQALQLQYLLAPERMAIIVTNVQANEKLCSENGCLIQTQLFCSRFVKRAKEEQTDAKRKTQQPRTKIASSSPAVKHTK